MFPGIDFREPDIMEKSPKVHILSSRYLDPVAKPDSVEAVT